MPFNDLNDFRDTALRLPIRGKVYVIQGPDIDTGLDCLRLLGIGQKAIAGKEISDEDRQAMTLNDTDEASLYMKLLGPGLHEMRADGVPWSVLQHAGMTALIWVGYGPDAAEEHWNAAPKAQPATQPQDRLAAKKSAPPASRKSSSSPKRATRKRTT